MGIPSSGHAGRLAATMSLAALAAALAAQAPATQAGTSTTATIELGSRLELFVDRYLVDSMKGVELRLHEPRDEGMVIRFDRPWEGPFCTYCTVIRDGELYRLYYRGCPTADAGSKNGETTCYAESNDGIHWTKPNLGIYEIGGTRDNNVVLAGANQASHNFTPFLDTRSGCRSDERFKAIGGTRKTGLAAYVSTDGLHWKQWQDKPVLTNGMFDSQNVAFWSATENCYVCYFRTWTGEGFSGMRTVSRSTSPDFLNWSAPVRMRFGDTPMEELYTNATQPYFRAPHVYVAIPARFMPNRQVVSDDEATRLNVSPKYYKDCSDSVLMTSRGGDNYDRTFMEGFIRPGIGLNNWVSRTNYTALGVVQTGPAEMSIYVNQDYAQPTAHLRRYTLRLDGFASARASYAGGELLTKPLTFTGSKLVVNFATSAAGGIRVEIQDQDGKPVVGHELESCREQIGNEIERTVSWNTGHDLADLAGKPVRLRLAMKDANLYSLRFR
jgi:hypothetical protein